MALTDSQIKVAASHVVERILQGQPSTRYIDAENIVHEKYAGADWTDSDIDKVKEWADKLMGSGITAMQTLRAKIADAELLVDLLKVLTHAHK